MKLRAYQVDDGVTLATLFYQTVHTINVKDYTAEQLAVWAPKERNMREWEQSFLAHHAVIAEIEGEIVGFGDMTKEGYLDRLYVHRDYQNRGIATAIVDELERKTMTQGISTWTTYASITAKPFFEKRGYGVVYENKVVRHGICLINFKMQKEI